jgi:hypothetical protein
MKRLSSMSMLPARRVTALAGVATCACTALVALGGGASAATPGATGQLIGGTDVTSTLSRDLDIRVTNPGVGKGNTNYINSVIIVPQIPAGGVVPQMTVTSGASNGWTAQVRPNGGIQFTAPGTPTAKLRAPLAPGQFTDFAFTAVAAGVPQDTPVVWEVDTSTDAGHTYTQAQPASADRLTSFIRVLVNGAPQINFITGTHNTTAGQVNLTLSQQVTNYATVPLDVKPSISGDSGDGVIGTPMATTLVPGQTATVTTPVQFGAAGTARLLWGGFVANGAASSRQPTAPYDVQVPVSLTYDGTTPLSPKAAPSSSSKTFTLTVQKQGDPSATLSAPTALRLTDTLVAAHTFAAPLSVPTTVASGSTSKVLSFGPVTIPGNPLLGDWDGVYSPTINVTGTDGNGAPIDITVGVSDVFAVSSLSPVASPTLMTPNHAAEVGDTRNGATNRSFTAKNGDTLTFSGPIYARANSSTTSPTAKVACFVDALKGTDVIAEQAVTCNNSAGQLSGSAAVTYPAEATAATLKVTTSDIAGNSATTTSNVIVVDNITPTLGFAITGCGWPVPWTCVDTQNIRIELSEPVTAQFNVSNFAVTVNGNEVPVTRLHFYGSGSVFSNLVALNLASPIGPDDKPVVRYIPSTPAPASDEAANQMAVLTRVDGEDKIPAPLPQLQKVNNKAAYDADGAYYTNLVSSSYAIANTQSGDTVSVYAETNGVSGLQPDADLRLCQVNPSGSTTQCSDPQSALPSDGTYSLYLQAVDPSGNVSIDDDGTEWSSATEVLDRVAPTLAGFNADASGVTVALSEIVSATGRDFATDWTVNNGNTTFVVGSVSAPDASHRQLSIASDDWVGLATSVTYLFKGSDGTLRYQDLAGNFLSDQTFPTGV